MARTPQDVTDAELAILQVLWERGPANRRQLTDRLYPGGNPAHYTTVQKLLERLEAKGYVASDKSGLAYVYKATLTRDRVTRSRLRTLLEQLYDGAAGQLALQLIKTERFSAEEIDELRGLIGRLDAKAAKGSRDKGT